MIGYRTFAPWRLVARLACCCLLFEAAAYADSASDRPHAGGRRIEEQGAAGSLRVVGGYPNGDPELSFRTVNWAYVVAVLPDGQALAFGDALADPAGRPAAEVLADRLSQIGHGLGKEPVAWNPKARGWTRPGMPPECDHRRTHHTMTVLPNNKVLVAGGWCDAPKMGDDTSPRETFTKLSLWSGETGKWEPVSATLSAERILHTASLLQDGSVMLVGGATGLHPENPGFHVVGDVELFRDGKVLGLPPLRFPRVRHTATPLPDGSLMVVGGSDDNGMPLDSIEIWNPARQAWRGATQLAHRRHSHTATVLADGRVLVAGGIGDQGQPLASVEIWDPASGSWSAGEPLPYPVSSHTAARLTGGDVLVAGGYWTRQQQTGRLLLWDHNGERWRPAGTIDSNLESQPLPQLTVAPRRDGSAHIFARGRVLHWKPQTTTDSPSPPFGERDYFTAATLADGRVLLAGGRLTNAANRIQRPPISDIAEVFDPVSGRFAVTGRMRQPWVIPSLLPLPDGRVLAAGGWVWDRDGGETPIANSPELWDPATGTWSMVDNIRFAPHERVHFGKLADGRILFVASNETPVANPADPAGQPAYRAWLWDLRTGAVETKAVGLKPHSMAAIAILPDGRVLRVGGNIRSVRPGNCKPSSRSGSGVGQCADQAPQWLDRADPSAEMWDSRNGEVTRVEPPPEWEATDGKALVLRNGDALFVAHQPVRFGHVMRLPRAAMLLWNSQRGWQRLPHLPSDKNWPLMELPDGTLWTPWYSLPPGASAWRDGPALIQESPAFVQLPNKGLLALSMQPPYAASMSPASDRWLAMLPQRAAPIWLGKPALAELADGRVLAIGKVEARQSAMPSAFIWDPRRDDWRPAALPLHPLGKAAQAIRLRSGNVLYTSIGQGDEGDRLQCELWNHAADRWQTCDGDIMTIAFATPPGVGLLEDGRALLVADTVTAYAFDENDKRWTKMTAEWNGEALRPGVAVRPEKPLQRVFDERNKSWLDAGGAAGRYWEGFSAGARLSPAYNSRSARIREPANGAPEMLWDATKGQWAYVLWGSQMGREARMLPDGCAFSWSPPSLFDPTTGKPVRLDDPGIGVAPTEGDMVVLADGTAVIMGKAEAGPGFFRHKVTCAGFAQAADDDALMPRKIASPTKAAEPAPRAKPASTWETRGIELWDDYRWMVLAVLGPLLLYFLLRKLVLPPLKRGLATLLPARAVETLKQPLPKSYARDTRLVVYGLLILLASPTLVSVLGQKMGETSRACADSARECLDPETGILRSVPRLEHGLLFFARSKPEIPCRFVGTWNARYGSEVLIATLKDDGTFTMTSPADRTHQGRAFTGAYRGYWMAQGGHLVWRPESGHMPELDINPIVKESAQQFELVERDGSHSIFELVRAGESTSCKR